MQRDLLNWRRPPDNDNLQDLTKLYLSQKRDDLLIKGNCFNEKNLDYRRKRSLKFRAKQRAWRTLLFQNPFHRKDRSKNLNKQVAAKRRKRDDTGKFNIEQELRERERKQRQQQQLAEERAAVEEEKQEVVVNEINMIAQYQPKLVPLEP